MKKLLLFAILGMFLGSCVQDKYVCGSKGQHKKRVTKMKSLAPNMTNR